MNWVTQQCLIRYSWNLITSNYQGLCLKNVILYTSFLFYILYSLMSCSLQECPQEGNHTRRVSTFPIQRHPLHVKPLPSSTHFFFAIYINHEFNCHQITILINLVIQFICLLIYLSYKKTGHRGVRESKVSLNPKCFGGYKPGI